MDEVVDIHTIGIPRALMFYRYGELWKSFFTELGFQVVVSEETDKDIFDLGDAASVDEVCLASKVYLGHVATLLDKCDAIFIPCFGNRDVRAGFCTKYQSLPDMVAATFRDRGANILTLHLERANDRKKSRAAYLDLAHRLGVNPHTASKALKAAEKAQDAANRKLAAQQQKTLRLMSEYRKVVSKDKAGIEEVPLAILLVAHPYIAHDGYISGSIVSAIERMGATVIFADQADHAASFKKSFEFSDTLPWVINRELAGAILDMHQKVDGIILLSAFPCGPDSMFDDAIMRNVKGVPILNLIIDSQSGSAGLETRIESFVDILKFQSKGSYLNG